MNPDVLVIGAGLGGLSCAVELARQGLKVRLLEAAELPGGCLRTFRKRGHHFHMSPQYLGSLQPGGAADAILVALGVRDQIETRRPPLFLTAELPSLRLQLPNDREGLLQTLGETFPREMGGVRGLFETVEGLSGAVLDSMLFPGRDPGSWRGQLDTWRGRTFQQLLTEHVVDPRLQALLGQTWMNMGLPPGRAAAPFAAAVFASGWLDGVATIVGGGTALVRALHDRLIELGGESTLGATVARIAVDRGQVRGVVLEDGTVIDSRLVVAAIDPFQVFQRLIPGPEVSRLFRFRLQNMEPSISMYSLHLGLDCAPSAIGVPGSTTFVNPQQDHDEAYRRAVEGELHHSSWRITSYEGSHDECAPPRRGHRGAHRGHARQQLAGARAGAGPLTAAAGPGDDARQGRASLPRPGGPRRAERAVHAAHPALTVPQPRRRGLRPGPDPGPERTQPPGRARARLGPVPRGGLDPGRGWGRGGDGRRPAGCRRRPHLRRAGTHRASATPAP